MNIDVYEKFSWKYMKIYSNYEYIVCQYLIMMQFRIPGFLQDWLNPPTSDGTLVSVVCNRPVHAPRPPPEKT